MVERVTGTTLEDYMAENIWRPLDINSVTFWPKEKPDLAQRLANMSILDPTGKAVPLQGFDIINKMEECMGGWRSFRIGGRLVRHAAGSSPTRYSSPVTRGILDRASSRPTE
jgi:CubicO group peptidase (beta-lactamase class C family)